MTAFSNYLAALDNGAALPVDTADREFVADWIDRYVPGQTITDKNLPHLSAVALRLMYAAAPQSVAQLGYVTATAIEEALTADPSRAVWGSCGDSTAWMMHCLGVFGCHCQDTSLWADISNGHEVCEFWHPAFEKIVVYDPLYGVYLLHEDGKPAGLTEIKENTPPSSAWSFQPIRLNGLTSMGTTSPVATQLQGYEAVNYNTGIVDLQYRIVARRFQFFDSLTGSGPAFNSYLPTWPALRGSWHVLDNWSWAGYSNFITWMMSNPPQYSLTVGGTYYLRFLSDGKKDRFIGWADVDGSGLLSEVWQLYEGSLRIRRIGGSAYTLSPIKVKDGWEIIGLVDVNGDGIDDIILVGPNGDIHAWILRPQTIGTTPTLFAGASLIGCLPAGADIYGAVARKRADQQLQVNYFDADGDARHLVTKFGMLG